MTDSLAIHPRRLAEGLENVAKFSKDAKGLEVNDTVYISWTGEAMRLMGRGRYCAGLHDMSVQSGEAEQWDLIIDIEDAVELGKMLKKVDGAGRKDGSVSLTQISSDHVAIHQGEHHVASLTQVEEHEEYRGSEEFEGIYEQLEKIAELPRQEAPPTSPITWTRGVIKKLLEVRVGDAHSEADRFECHWIGGATWAYRIISPNHPAAFLALLESTRDNLE